MKRTLLAAIIFVSAGPALADKIYDKCINQSDGSNSAWSQCGGDWLKRADGKLNTAWKKFMAKPMDKPKPICWQNSDFGIATKNRPATFTQMVTGAGKDRFLAIPAVELA